MKKRSSTSEDDHLIITCSKKKTRIDPQHILPAQVFQSNILSYLPLKDAANAKSVSSSWKNAVAAAAADNNNYSAPWLTLPPAPEEEEDGRTRTPLCRFKNVEENIIYSMKKTTSDLLLKFPCIGSSLGWLLLFDVSTFTPFLFNPFTEDRIQLPSLKSLFYISTIDQIDDADGGGYRTVSVRGKFRLPETYDKDCILKAVFTKAVLVPVPIPGRECYSVVLIYQDPNCRNCKIGYWKNGSSGWIELSRIISTSRYQDIICFNNKLYALLFDRTSTIHTWDLQNLSPEARTVINPCSPPTPPPAAIARDRLGRYLWRIQSYLVESGGEIMLVERFIYFGHPLDMSQYHSTCLFRVHKLVEEAEECAYRWIQVDSIGDRALFLGGNHSVSVSTKGFQTCTRNSIYFTDDYWSSLKLCQYGYDNGVFSLEDGRITGSKNFEFDRATASKYVMALPCWIPPPNRS